MGRVSDIGEVVLGNERLMKERRLMLATADLRPAFESAADESFCEVQQQGSAALCFVGWNGRVQGAFAFCEQLRPDAAASLSELRALGYRVLMLSGDRPERAGEVARQLGMEFAAELLPEDKLAAIAKLQASSGKVVMVGDGLNDAPALAAADVGIALASGTDVSRFSSSICLLRNDLRHVPWLARLARHTVQTIRWNLLWALAYNVIGVGIAATGWLNPIVAAVAMVVSSLLVVSNSLRLARDGDEDEFLSHPAVPQTDRSELVGVIARESATLPARSRAFRRPRMIELPLLLMAGLLGSSHCLGMCGPFALILGSGPKNLRSNFARQGLYTLGRVFTYAFLGAAAGFGGWRLAGAIPAVNIPATLAIAAGVLLVYQGLAAAGVIRKRGVGDATGCLRGGFGVCFIPTIGQGDERLPRRSAHRTPAVRTAIRNACTRGEYARSRPRRRGDDGVRTRDSAGDDPGGGERFSSEPRYAEERFPRRRLVSGAGRRDLARPRCELSLFCRRSASRLPVLSGKQRKLAGRTNRQRCRGDSQPDNVEHNNQ